MSEQRHRQKIHKLVITVANTCGMSPSSPTPRPAPSPSSPTPNPSSPLPSPATSTQDATTTTPSRRTSSRNRRPPPQTSHPFRPLALQCTPFWLPRVGGQSLKGGRTPALPLRVPAALGRYPDPIRMLCSSLVGDQNLLHRLWTFLLLH
jgi:hypothetical protein